MEVKLTPGWKKVIEAELNKPYFKELTQTITSKLASTQVYPDQASIFKAFDLCPFEKVAVVILGQDPYHGEGQAMGLSFSVPEVAKLPPSLRNIYKELKDDIGISRTSGSLEDWAQQGVLLLNATLTVEAGRPGSHKGLGWENFTDNIIKIISEQKEHVVFLLWGKYAAAKKNLIDTNKHLILIAPHPSPFSAYTGFFGSRHFSQTNDYLLKHNKVPINW